LSLLSQALLALLLQRRFFRLPAFHLVAANLPMPTFQFSQGVVMLVERRLFSTDLTLQTVSLNIQALNLLVQQVDTTTPTVTIDSGQKFVEAAAFIQQQLSLLMLLSCRNQGLHLPSCGNHSLVRRIEFIELTDQSIRHLEGRWFVQHEVPQEGIEIAEVLGRLGLVQQAQRHLALDTEQSTKPLSVGAEFAAMKGIG
jgi:hypothetical protein